MEINIFFLSQANDKLFSIGYFHSYFTMYNPVWELELEQHA